MSEEGLNNSIVYFERALQRDPGFAQAYAGISLAYLQLGFISLLALKTPSRRPGVRQRRL